LLYLINVIDRVNISFAALRMKSELGFSDSVYGFGASIFFLTYIISEIPGAIVVERWSARKWIARIMVSWGLLTIVTAFIRTTHQFYAMRLLLGAAEASFYPGVIVYLTHWFTAKERAKAVAVFYAAVPAASLIGAALAGSLLGVHWMGISGWRWLFIVEGLPAVLIGIVTLFYLADQPSDVRWLDDAERDWLIRELGAEKEEKAKLHRLSFFQTCKDPWVLCLLGGYFSYQTATTSNTFWLPTFLQRLTNLPATSTAKLVMLPALAGLFGLLLNARHSDQTGERKWHTVVPIFCAACCYLLIAQTARSVVPIVALTVLYSAFSLAAVPSFWAMPTTLLSGTTAAATFGLIMSVAQTGGFFGPLMVGRINDHFRSVRPSIFFIACSMFCSATILAAAKIGVSASSPQLAGAAASAAGFQRDHVIPEIEIQAGWPSS